MQAPAASREVGQGGVDEAQVEADQFGESRIGAALGEVEEELGIRTGIHFPCSSRRAGNRTGEDARAVRMRSEPLLLGNSMGFARVIAMSNLFVY